MTAPDVNSISTDRPKLGLALSGGGFRATIFHIGVLRRLAELDLLRHVGVISTVSGGSLTGAHYLLHLKEAIERLGQLTRDDYIDITADMESDFRRGVRVNPRSLLMADPIANLQIFCTARPPGQRMASLYQRYFFQAVTETMAARRPGANWKKGLPLKDARIAGIEDIECHNRWDAKAGRTEVKESIPKFILNASSLNSGQSFQFTAAEVGDGRLGFIRFDEVDVVVDCKRMLLRAQSSTAERAHAMFPAGRPDDDEATARHAITAQPGCLTWYLSTITALAQRKKTPGGPPTTDMLNRPRWDQNRVVAELAERFDLSTRLVEAPFDVLRKAKIAAWFLLDGGLEGENRRGGYTKKQHELRFWAAISDVDKQLKEALFADGDTHPDLLQFVLCLYYLRSADAFAWDVAKGLSRLRLVDAAAASANFPPVFTPYHINNLYDPRSVRLLSLTDGGVHDNTGIKALMEEECTDIIASDVSGLFRHASGPRGDRINMMNQIGSVFTAHIRDVQLRILHDGSEVSRAVWKTKHAIPEELEKYDLMSTAFFHMLSNPSDARVDSEKKLLNPTPVPPHPSADLIANVRTDLDVFGKIEIDALLYQGYQLADRFVRRYLREEAFPGIDQYPPEIGKPDETPFAGRVLKASSKRVGRVAAIYSRVFSIVAIAALVSLAVVMRVGHCSLLDLFQPVGELAIRVQHRILGLFGETGTAADVWRGYWQLPAMAWHGVLHHHGLAGLVIGGAALFLFFTDGWEHALGSFLTRRIGGRARTQLWRLNVSRALGTWRRNLAWAIWLLPLWIAFVFAIFGDVLILAGFITAGVTSRSSIRVFKERPKRTARPQPIT